MRNLKVPTHRTGSNETVWGKENVRDEPNLGMYLFILA
jgi:hypothetical protein